MPETVSAWELLSEYNRQSPLICTILSKSGPVPFWGPQTTSWNIDAKAVDKIGSRHVSLWEIPCQKYILRTSANVFIQLYKSGVLLQLACPSTLELGSTLYLDLTISLDCFLGRQTSLMCKLYGLVFNDISPKRNQNRQKKLQEYLIALDADLLGLSYREIAIKLWGESLVFEDWKGGQGYLKNRVRRYVARGHYYMNGGYLDLLKK